MKSDRDTALEILDKHWGALVCNDETENKKEFANELYPAAIEAMIEMSKISEGKEIILDNLPIQVYEVYEIIEKLFVPEGNLYHENPQLSNCLLLILNNLYYTDPNGKDKED